MTDTEWNAFLSFRENFRSQCKIWNERIGKKLLPLQKSLVKEGSGFYEVENPIVYNEALDEITEDSEIKIILIGDNPGKSEQLEINKKYLVGLSGKIGEKFFREHPVLDTDFRKNVIILNKTPIHTARTEQLKELSKSDEEIANIIEETQIFMAETTSKLLGELKNAKLWCIGYSELKKRGIFSTYRDVLKKNCDMEKVFVYQHFSMNRFTIDLSQFSKSFNSCSGEDSLEKRLEDLGRKHRLEIFI